MACLWTLRNQCPQRWSQGAHPRPRSASCRKWCPWARARLLEAASRPCVCGPCPSVHGLRPLGGRGQGRVQGAGPVPDRGRWLCWPAQGPLPRPSSGGVWDVLQEQPGEGPQHGQQEQKARVMRRVHVLWSVRPAWEPSVDTCTHVCKDRPSGAGRLGRPGAALQLGAPEEQGRVLQCLKCPVTASVPPLQRAAWFIGNKRIQMPLPHVVSELDSGLDKEIKNCCLSI